MNKMVSRCAVLAVLCLCLCLYEGTAYSLFKQAVSGADSIRVAAFAIDATVEPENKENISVTQNGENKIGTLSVTNVQNQVISEVNEEYTVILNSSAQLPEGVTLCLRKNGESTEYQGAANRERTKFSFESDDFSFTYGVEENHQYDVYIVWEGMTLPESIDVDVTATVIGEQID